MRLREPAADLAVCAAIASAVRDVSWPPEMAFLGEVGLAGELRAVPQVLGCISAIGSMEWAYSGQWGSGVNGPVVWARGDSGRRKQYSGFFYAFVYMVVWAFVNRVWCNGTSGAGGQSLTKQFRF